MRWICPSCNKSSCVGCEPADNAMPQTHEVLCACADSCAKDAEIVRLRAALVVAYNRMPTYAFDIDDLNSDRKIVADAIGLPYAPTCIAVEQSMHQKS